MTNDPSYPCVQYNYVMTNIEKEKNEAVARKLGWKRHNKTCEQLTPGASIFTYGNHWHKKENICRERVPDFCTSIEAAWEIVEHEKGRSTSYGMDHFILLHRYSDSEWTAGWGYLSEDGYEWNSRSDADTAPMAIIDAFLKVP